MRKRKTKETKQPANGGPPDAFCEWWNPSGTDTISGASIGGHPDASRVWSRKDEGRYTHRTYGISAVHAWMAENYRAEYQQWVDVGRPAALRPFVSLGMPLSQQVEHWKEIHGKLKAIAKPMPRMRHTDLQREQMAAGHKPDIAEPIDFEERNIE